MTPPARPQLVTALALALIAVCLALLTFHFWPVHRYVFQIYAVVALLLALHAAPPVARWITSVPPVHRGILYLMLAAVVAGHLTLQQRRYFPFVVWDIFSTVREQETVFCRELVGTTASGRPVRLLVEQLFPSIVQFDLPPDSEPDAMGHLAAALAAQYNAHHPADPVRAVDLMLLAVKLHPPPGQTSSQPSCELLQHFDLSPDHSS